MKTMKTINTISCKDIEVKCLCSNEEYAAFNVKTTIQTSLIEINDRKTFEKVWLKKDEISIFECDKKVQSFYPNSHTGKTVYGAASWEITYEMKDGKVIYTVKHYV